MSMFTCPQCHRDIPCINEVVHTAQCRRKPNLPPQQSSSSSIIDSEPLLTTTAWEDNIATEMLTDNVEPSSSSSSCHSSAPPSTFLPDGWPCSSCTYVNDDACTICEMCGNRKLQPREFQPLVEEILDDEEDDDMQDLMEVDNSIIEIDDDEDVAEFVGIKWTCEQCTYRNETLRNYCEMCNRVRPSLPSYHDRLIPDDDNSDNHYHHQNIASGSSTIESTIFGAGLGASIGGGMAYLNGRSVRSGALEGAGFGALGGLLFSSMLEMNEEDEMNTMFTRRRFNQQMPLSDMLQHLDSLQMPPPQRGVDHERMSQLPTRQYKVIQGKIEQCSICLENFKDKESVRTLPCLHQFHEHCVDQWLHRSQQCPVCKHEIR